MNIGKKKCLFLLFLLFLICLCGFWVSSSNVYAEEDKSKKDFYFSYSDVFIGEDNESYLCFNLIKNNTNNLTYGGTYRYYFDFYRYNANGTSTKLASCGKRKYGSSADEKVVGYYYYPDEFNKSFVSFYKRVNGNLVKTTNPIDFGSDNSILVVFKCDPSVEYELIFAYCFANNNSNTSLDIRYSEKVSYTSLIKNKVDDNGYSSVSDMADSEYFYLSDVEPSYQKTFFKDFWSSLYDDSLLRIVNVQYLENIPNTPFAFLKTAYNVTLHYYNNGFSDEELRTALNLPTLKVLSSNFGRYVYDSETGTVRLLYLNSVWLRTKTVDGGGHYTDYFLDLNTNFKDFYSDFVSTGILNGEQSEYCLNKCISDYQRQIDNYRERNNVNINSETIYGYFGGAIIPESYSLNKLMSDIFDVPTGISGVVDCFHSKVTLSSTSYNQLLTEYGYGWISRIWDGIFSSAVSSSNANFYVFYGDNSTDRSVISETGSSDFDNDRSVIGNGVQSIISSIMGIFGNSVFSKILAILFFIVLIPLIIKFYRIIFPKKNNRQQESDNKKRKKKG